MKRLLLLILALVAIAGVVVFAVFRNAQHGVDISLRLNGDQLLCDGQPAGSGWMQVWRGKLNALIESESKAEPDKLSRVTIRKRRLVLKLDPELSYSAFCELLSESA